MTEKVAPGEDQKYPLPSLEDLYESDSHFFFSDEEDNEEGWTACTKRKAS